jgi:hypothetical protein
LIDGRFANVRKRVREIAGQPLVLSGLEPKNLGRFAGNFIPQPKRIKSNDQVRIIMPVHIAHVRLHVNGADANAFGLDQDLMDWQVGLKFLAWRRLRSTDLGARALKQFDRKDSQSCVSIVGCGVCESSPREARLSLAQLQADGVPVLTNAGHAAITQHYEHIIVVMPMKQAGTSGRNCNVEDPNELIRKHGRVKRFFSNGDCGLRMSNARQQQYERERPAQSHAGETNSESEIW